MLIKAISLWQPYGSLIAFHEKCLETRGWATNHRGVIAVHAAKGWTREQDVICGSYPFMQTLLKHGQPEFQRHQDFLPLGAIVAVAEIADCLESHLCRELKNIGKHEIAFGDFSDGRYGWLLTNVRALKEPIPAKGAQGLWNWDAPDNIEELLEAA